MPTLVLAQPVVTAGVATFVFGFGAGAALNLYLIVVRSPLTTEFRGSLNYVSSVVGDGIVLPIVNMVIVSFLLSHRESIDGTTVTLAVGLGIVIAFTLLGSIVFAAPSSNGTICFVCAAGMLLLGRHLNKVALSLAEPLQSLLYTAYFVLPHLELFDVRELIIHDAGSIRWDMVALATLYATAYAAFFLYAAWLAFRRRPLN